MGCGVWNDPSSSKYRKTSSYICRGTLRTEAKDAIKHWVGKKSYRGHPLLKNVSFVLRLLHTSQIIISVSFFLTKFPCSNE